MAEMRAAAWRGARRESVGDQARVEVSRVSVLLSNGVVDAAWIRSSTAASTKSRSGTTLSGELRRRASAAAWNAALSSSVMGCDDIAGVHRAHS